ncbi:MAG: hypothetical protein DRO96_02975 [Candidatus Aenigmatarchaeota archaeon]|nr:MAG: hypothetical protein DRO96_02975 [Candidatus Aenigmarchaeota archaeon]
MINVTLFYRNEKIKSKVSEGTTIEELLKKLKINRETVLIFKNKEPIPDTYKLKDGDKIEAMLITTRG